MAEKENPISLQISNERLQELFQELVTDTVKRSIVASEANIIDAIKDYFHKNWFGQKEGRLTQGIDWAIEHAFREGLTIAMEELKFKELVAEKAKEILSDPAYISSLADQKVRETLGLAPKTAE